MTTSSPWDRFLQAHPETHLLQTSQWAALKQRFGWHAETVQTANAGALVLFRDLPLGRTLAYIPMGPSPSSLQSIAELLPALDDLCRRKHAILLKIEPDCLDSEAVRSGLIQLGFRPSPQHIQPPRTILLDISGTEEEALTRIKSKTRYAIRSSEKRGVRVHASTDMGIFYALMRETGDRDAFAIHSEEYYRAVFSTFTPHVDMELLIATFEERPIAGVIVFARGSRAWYLYGASTEAHRDLMAPRLLQWESIRWAKSRGCTQYDLWGIPDHDEAQLESEFDHRSDGLWSLYRYKRGFGGSITRFAGAWDRVYSPVMHSAYLVFLKLRGRRGD
jgi:peptidoglycan pentaglycine glycine transferase (the first glycine)